MVYYMMVQIIRAGLWKESTIVLIFADFVFK